MRRTSSCLDTIFFFSGFLFFFAANSLLLCHGQKILHNIKAYTVAADPVWADAVAIDENGTIVGVGNFSSVEAEFPTYASEDLDGQLVLPGFQDVHLHAVEGGINSQLCYVDAEAPIEEIPFWFDECDKFGEFGDQGWVMGAGVDLEFIVSELERNPRARYPITVLDESWPNTPVVILDQYGHGALANTKALEEVGYQNGQDPPGGQILVDEDGFLLGIVLENAQQKLREAAFPPTEPNKKVAYRSLQRALEELRSNGITTVSDAGGFWRQAQTESWETALNSSILTVRASNALYVYPDESISTQLEKLEARYSNNPNSLLRFNQAKIYVDGILSLSSSKLYDDYLYDPFEYYRTSRGPWTGFEYFGDNTTLNFYSQALATAGFQLHFHVTGDEGARIALEAIRFVQDSGTDTSGGPHRLTHCYLVDELDLPLFEELGVVADMQIAPSSMDDGYNDNMREVLGETRAAALLPGMELYEAGAMLTLSSDWDADTLSPLAKMETVLTRPYGRSFPDLESVIPMLTLNAAKLLQHNDKTGSIEVGKFADLVVIDKDIFSLEFDQISTAKVTRTYLQGELIFSAAGVARERGDGLTTIEDSAPSRDSSDSSDTSGGLQRMTRFVHAVCILATSYMLFN